MPWLKLDDGFASHPKITALSDRELRIWLRTLLYCARYRTQGHVPRTAIVEIPGLTNSMRNRFESEGLLDVKEGEDWVHDWAEFNPKDPTAADRMERLRQRKKEAEERNARRNADRNEGVTESSPRALAGARDPSPTTEPLGVVVGADRRDKTPPPDSTRTVPPAAPGEAPTEVDLSRWSDAERWVRADGWMLDPSVMTFRLFSDFGMEAKNDEEAYEVDAAYKALLAIREQIEAQELAAATNPDGEPDDEPES